jgi:hypothetical protein
VLPPDHIAIPFGVSFAGAVLIAFLAFCVHRDV